MDPEALESIAFLEASEPSIGIIGLVFGQTEPSSQCFRLCLDELSGDSHALGLTLEDPCRQHLVESGVAGNTGALGLQVRLWHPLKLLPFSQDTADRRLADLDTKVLPSPGSDGALTRVRVERLVLADLKSLLVGKARHDVRLSRRLLCNKQMCCDIEAEKAEPFTGEYSQD